MSFYILKTRHLARAAQIAAVLAIPSAACAFSWGGEGRQVVEFRLGGGWGSYEMSALNDEYIEKVGRQLDVFSDKIRSGPGISAGGGYFLNPDLVLGMQLTWLTGSTDHEGTHVIETIDGPVTLDIDSDMKTTMIAAELTFRYYLPAPPRFDRIRAYLGGSAAWCHGSVSLDVDYSGFDSGSSNFSAGGAGLSGSAGLNAEVAGPFSFFIETGYRYFRTGTLKDGAGGEWTLDILEGRPEVNLDFSGLYAQCGFSLRVRK